jgi:hypothetical protein
MATADEAQIGEETRRSLLVFDVGAGSGAGAATGGRRSERMDECSCE